MPIIVPLAESTVFGTFGHTRNRVSRTIGDISEAVVSTDDILDWANDAQLDIVRRTEVLQSVETLPIVGGVDPTESVATVNDYLKFYRVTFNNKFLFKVELQDLDQFVRDRDLGPTVGNDVTKWYWYQRRIFLYPILSAGISGTIKVWGIQKPTRLTVDASVYQIPDYMLDAVYCFCVGRAKQQNEDEPSAERWLGEYEARVAQYTTDAQEIHADSYPLVRDTQNELDWTHPYGSNWGW